MRGPCPLTCSPAEVRAEIVENPENSVIISLQEMIHQTDDFGQGGGLQALGIFAQYGKPTSFDARNLSESDKR